MRRSFIISSVLAGTALLGACSNSTGTNNQAPNKPVTTSPSPIATASPAASPASSPAVSPVASPAKPGASPEMKPDLKGTPEKKPAETPKAK